MGWKEFLEDYEASELEEYEKFKKRVMEDKFNREDTYPPADRFPELRKPISRFFEIVKFSDKDRIWSRIPLSGSTIHGLAPLPESMFHEMMGFPLKQIPEVIDFIRETGKLQFVLRNMPSAYVNCEFLEPFFHELRPPLGVNFPPDAFFDEEELRRYVIEFDTLAESKVIPSIVNWSIETTGSTENAKGLIGQYRHTYVCLKALGYRDIVEELEQAILIDVNETAKLIFLGGLLVTQPFFDPLAHSFIVNTDIYAHATEFAESHLLEIPKPTFPGEIGEFIIRKLVHCAPSLDACKHLVFRYEDQDVYKLANALSEGIVENEPDAVIRSSKDLSMILDDIWKDKTLPNRVKELKVGIPVLFGVVGALGCGIPGGIGGVLAGLGFSVGDKFIGGMAEGIAEKIAKLRSPNWELIVYDFKKKYHLNTSHKKIGE